MRSQNTINNLEFQQEYQKKKMHHLHHESIDKEQKIGDLEEENFRKSNEMSHLEHVSAHKKQ